MIPLAFANIGMLAALIALPAIWFFLRLTPPKPRLEDFPPMRLLLRIARKEEQPARSPWWLTALRLTIATAVILALAGPVYNPVEEEAPGTGPLMIVVDNGWAAAARWDVMIDSAKRMVGLAAESDRPVALLAAAEGVAQAIAPTDPQTIAERLEALAPRPWPADYARLARRLGEAGGSTVFGGALWLSSGVDQDGAAAFGAALESAVEGPVVAYLDSAADIVVLAPPVNAADALSVPVIRAPSAAAMAGIVRARDIKGRNVGEAASFETSYIVDLAPQIGVRQTRLLEGEYVVTKEDVQERVHFPDSVARGRDYYTPYRALLPKNVEQLLVAGRHYSATSTAQKTSREIPPCMAMGEAVGVAAAMALDAGTLVRNVDVPTLQKKLRAQGADPGDVPSANATLRPLREVAQS